MTQWKTKNEEVKEYRASFGTTDYNIPTIGYKSAFFICGLSVLVVIFVPSFVAQMFNGIQWPGIIVSSIMIGFIISYGQHFIQSDKGMCKSFWWVASLFSIFSFIVLFIALYGKVML